MYNYQAILFTSTSLLISGIQLQIQSNQDNVTIDGLYPQSYIQTLSRPGIRNVFIFCKTVMTVLDHHDLGNVSLFCNRKKCLTFVMEVVHAFVEVFISTNRSHWWEVLVVISDPSRVTDGCGRVTDPCCNFSPLTLSMSVFRRPTDVDGQT